MLSLLHAGALALALLGAEEPNAPTDPAVSRRVAELISLFNDPEARSTKIEQSQLAIAELVRIGPPAAPQLVRAILSGQETESAYSANALDEVGKPAVDAVRKLWETMDETSRWKLMRFRGKHDYDAALGFALGSLDAKDEKIRYQAIRYLGQYKEGKARDKLLHMLNADLPRARWEIVDALIRIGGDTVVDAFIELLAPRTWVAQGDGLQFDVPPPWGMDGRPRIVEALRILGARKAGPSLLKVLQDQGLGTGYLGPIIIPVLRDLGCDEAVPELRRILATDPDVLSHCHEPAEVQSAAAAALWHFGDRLGRPLLIHFHLNPGFATGESLEYAFGKLADKGDIWVLARFLDAPGWHGPQFGSQALERITGITNRALGWAIATEHDAPLWRQWYGDHRRELPRMSFPSQATGVRQKSAAQAHDDGPGKALTEMEFKAIWSNLNGANHSAAFRAMLRLLESSEASVRFLASRLEPLENADLQTVRGLIVCLDADDFSVRERAESQLQKVGQTAGEEIRTALQGSPSAETALRLRRLLGRLSDPIDMRELRAITVLEAIGTVEAAATLSRIARGDPASSLTLEASAALERLQQRHCD
jgi:HEAT repeat protein